jgi:hypothetical protein
LLSSPILGQDILAPPATFDALALFTSLMICLILAIIYSLLIAFIIHRGGLISGIIGGALLGLALYLIIYYLLTYFFPWFFALRGWVPAITYLIYGALAGGIYEALEVEIFVPAEE